MTVYKVPKPRRKSKPVRKSVARSPVKKRNSARHAKNQLRAYGPKERRAWMRKQPCLFCGAVGFSVSAHLEVEGAGRKASYLRTLPMCDTKRYFERDGIPRIGCHQRYDAHLLILPDAEKAALAAECESAWQAHVGAVSQIEQRRASESVLPFGEVSQ